MKNNADRLRSIVFSAVIAAVYAGLTYISAAFGIAYGPIQFRFSEALTVLPIITPAAIPGLTVGCLLANITSYNPVDMVFGTAATLIAALLSYALRKIKIKGCPLLSVLMPVIINGLIVGFEIAVFFSDKKASFAIFALSAAEVALGEAAVCILLGIPLYFALTKTNIMKTIRYDHYRQ